MPLWQPTSAIARPVYYDRQASPVAKLYNAVVAGHNTTIRWTYIPAAGIAVFVEVVTVYMDRQAPAAPASLSDAIVTYTPFGTSGMILDAVLAILTGVGDSKTEIVTSFGYMAAGDQMQASTFDASTGGTIEYTVAMKGTEFRR